VADSKRLQILKALTSLLEDISTGAGYSHDLYGRVFRGRELLDEAQPLPCVSILESLNPDRDMITVGGESGRKQIDRWYLLFHGWAEDDVNNPSDPAHHLMADVKRCLAQVMDQESDHFLLGGLIENASMEPGVVRPPSEVSSTATFYLRVVLKVVETLGNP
jgi:hypothetical protein